MTFDEMMQDLNSGKPNEFEIFGASLGALMARGLNSLTPEKQQFVLDAVNGGGEVFALCRTTPLSLAGMLSHKGKNYELFRLTEEATIN